MVKCARHIEREAAGHGLIALVRTHLKQSGRRFSSGSTNSPMPMPKSCSSVCRKACPALSRQGNCELSNDESNSGVVKSPASWCWVLNRRRKRNQKCTPSRRHQLRRDASMINWLDFKSIKRGVKLESVLRHYHVELRRSGKDQYRGCCPIHRGDGRDAFHVNLARNVFHCFACGAGGTVLDFMAAMERCSLYAAAQKLQDVAVLVGPAEADTNGRNWLRKEEGFLCP
jgi:hypothetical protein